MDPLETILLRRQLRWVGHTFRMPEDRVPRKILYGELATGRRAAGGPRKRYKDHIKTSLKKCDIQPTQLEALASNRQLWRSSCSAGTEVFTRQHENAAEQRRLRRHQPDNQDGNFPCEVCGRICKSRIGLHSHRRTHPI